MKAALFWGSYILGLAALILVGLAVAFLSVKNVTPASVETMLAYIQANPAQQEAVHAVLSDVDFQPARFREYTKNEKAFLEYIRKSEQQIAAEARAALQSREAGMTDLQQQQANFEPFKQINQALEDRIAKQQAVVDAKIEQLWRLAMLYQQRMYQDALLAQSAKYRNMREMLQQAEEPEQAARLLNPLPADDVVAHLAAFRKQKDAMKILAALDEAKRDEVAQRLNAPTLVTPESMAESLQLSPSELTALEKDLDEMLASIVDIETRQQSLRVSDKSLPDALDGQKLNAEQKQALLDFLRGIKTGYQGLVQAAKAEYEKVQGQTRRP